MGRRIGVLGGTFDPIHDGHLVAAEEVRHVCRLDKVVFMPAGTPPHKMGQRVTAVEHRLAMVQLAVQGNPHFACSDIDIKRSGPSYTVDLLELLHQLWGPETELFFIMGYDSLGNLPTWHEPCRLFDLAQIVVVDRPRYDLDLDKLNAQLPGCVSRITFVNIPDIETSSSDIRQRVREGRPIKYQLPEAVEAYIYAQNLYPPPSER